MTNQGKQLSLLEYTLLKAGLIDVSDSFVEGKVLVVDLIGDEQIVAAADFAKVHGVSWQRKLLQFFLMLVENEDGAVIRRLIGLEIEEVGPLIDLVVVLTGRAAADAEEREGLPN